MKRSAILLILLVISLVLPVSATADPLFSLQIRPDPAGVAADGTLSVTLQLTNVSSQPRTIYTGCLYPSEMIRLFDPQGAPVPAEFTITYDVIWSPEGFRTLAPGEFFSWTFRAVWIPDQGLVFKSCVIQARQAGEYTLQGVFSGWEGVTTDATGKQVPIGQALSLPSVFTETVESATVAVRLQ